LETKKMLVAWLGFLLGLFFFSWLGFWLGLVSGLACFFAKKIEQK
jgi:hypothetical protein